MIIAAFDFGSNSIKCTVAQAEAGEVSYLKEVKITNRLAASFDAAGNISAEAIYGSIEAVKSIMQHTCSTYKPNSFLAVGTEALRKAANADAFVQAILASTGVELKIISSAEEAKLSWLGVMSSLPDNNAPITVFDSGGASTEIIIGNQGKIINSISIPLGAVSLHKDFVHSDPISAADFNKLTTAIQTGLQLPFNPQGRLIGTGGGILAIAKVAYGSDIADYNLLDGYILSARQLEEQIELYRQNKVETIQQIPGMEPERADIILSAALLYRAIMHTCGVEEVHVSTRGVRHGLIYKASKLSC
jgi:exopolyphosphatase/guanosine-5'-triphosphate,3'-diphosphate pyrophosphatase